jgi:hypothetical protein
MLVHILLSTYRYQKFSISTNQQTDESKLQAAKQKAERETAEYKQRVLGFVFFFKFVRPCVY